MIAIAVITLLLCSYIRANIVAQNNGQEMNILAWGTGS